MQAVLKAQKVGSTWTRLIESARLHSPFSRFSPLRHAELGVFCLHASSGQNGDIRDYRRPARSMRSITNCAIRRCRYGRSRLHPAIRCLNGPQRMAQKCSNASLFSSLSKCWHLRKAAACRSNQTLSCPAATILARLILARAPRLAPITFVPCCR